MTKYLSEKESQRAYPNGAIIPAKDGDLTCAASELLASRNRSCLLTSYPPNEFSQVLARIERVYLDLDGTTVLEGAVHFPDSLVELFEALSRVGVEVCLGPTGKPLTEVLPLLEALPRGLQVLAIFEKGAYRLRSDNPAHAERFLVSEPQEVMMSRLRVEFFRNAHAIEREFGVRIVAAGSGDHKALISFDVFEQEVEVKLSTREILEPLGARIMSLLEAEATRHGERLTLVDLGNGNLEVALSGVGKAHAVLRDMEERGGVSVAVAGDSHNDGEMLALSSSHGPIHGCLVLHRRSALPLVGSVQSVVYGEANIGLFLRAILDSKGRR